MPLHQSMVGRAGKPAVETVDPRWVMNYAASVGDTNPVYFDTAAAHPLPAHPAYVSHLEWEAIGNLQDELSELSAEERIRGVHSFNDTTIHRPIHAGDELSSISEVIGVETRRSGAKLTLLTETSTADGAPVSTSVTTSIYRGLEFAGDDVVPPAAEPVPVGEWDHANSRTKQIDLSPIAAHVFSECARDYSPIHTDIAIATEAGLPGLILHGTGTFALVLSDLVNAEAGEDPRRVTRFRARLGAMVLCPSVLSLTVTPNANDATVFRFELETADKGLALSDGVLCTASGVDNP